MDEVLEDELINVCIMKQLVVHPNFMGGIAWHLEVLKGSSTRDLGNVEGPSKIPRNTSHTIGYI